MQKEKLMIILISLTLLLMFSLLLLNETNKSKNFFMNKSNELLDEIHELNLENSNLFDEFLDLKWKLLTCSDN